MKKNPGARILGPYADRDKWRIISVDAAGNRESVVFETEAKAERYKELLAADLSTEQHTTETALELYKVHLRTKGNKRKPVKEQTVAMNVYAIRSFFPEPLPLHLLSAKRCEKLYETLCTAPRKATGTPPSADTHRSALARVKTFLNWCVAAGLMRENPAEAIEGIGERRPRGKSLGKRGHEFHIQETRVWYRRALELAQKGDKGAIAALVALLLGMRASEITQRRVGDLDTDQQPSDVLWIPCSKTKAGRRTLEVPEVLRPLLVACCEGKASTELLFACKNGKPHRRDWIREQVHRICDLVGLPQVTAHAMRGQLATITTSRGLAGHFVAQTLGHEDERITMSAYAAPGSAMAGAARRGWAVLNGGVQSEPKSATGED